MCANSVLRQTLEVIFNVFKFTLKSLLGKLYFDSSKLRKTNHQITPCQDIELLTYRLN